MRFPAGFAVCLGVVGALIGGPLSPFPAALSGSGGRWVGTVALLAAAQADPSKAKPVLAAPPVKAPAPAVQGPASSPPAVPPPTAPPPPAPQPGAPNQVSPPGGGRSSNDNSQAVPRPPARPSAPAPGRPPTPAAPPVSPGGPPSAPRISTPKAPVSTTPDPRNVKPPVPTVPNLPGVPAPAHTGSRTPSSTANPQPKGRPAGGGGGTSTVVTATTPGGARVQSDPQGQGTYRAADGRTTARLQSGRVAEIRRGNIEVLRPTRGPRTVVAQHPGNRVVVVRSAGSGYVQRPFIVAGRGYVQRTYYVNRQGFVRAYRPVLFRGAFLYFYEPLWYYPAPFYSWTVGPWAAPVLYSWEWADEPWFAYYGPFFRPYPSYARPSFWLTDYLIAATLQEAYIHRTEAEAQAQTPQKGPDPVEGAAPLSDEVKNLIEAEVRRQLAEAQAEAEGGGANKAPKSNALPPSFTVHSSHTFIAPEVLEVTDSEGKVCQIAQGNILTMDALPRNGSVAELRVVAGRGLDCPVGSRVSVALAAVAEMHSHMRAALDDGLKRLHDSQGKDNIPELPPDAAPPVSTRFGSLAPDADASQWIDRDAREADQIEQLVVSDAGRAVTVASNHGNRYPPAPTAEAPLDSSKLSLVKKGQTEDEVIAILGEPAKTTFLGGLRKAFEYPAGKIVFTDGLVNEIQTAKDGAPVAAPRAAPAPAPAATPVESAPQPGKAGGVRAGQTEDQVIALLGQPRRVAFLGGLRKQYEYADQKVVFVDGLVSEIRK